MIAAAPSPPLRAILLALLALASLSSPGHADEQITTRFEVVGFAGINILTLHSRTEESGGRYAITVDYATKGMANVLDSVSSHSEVHGRLVPGSAQPDWFRNDTRHAGVDRHSRVDYHPNGTIDSGVIPPLSPPIPLAAMAGTVDNLTAYLRLQRQLARTGSCALSARVFDGRHAYDLIFTDAGREALTPSGGQKFSGSTIACRMRRQYLPGVVQPDKDEGARAGTIWYARLVPGDLMVPVRMQLDTQFGTVDAYLAELHGGGVNLTFME